MEHTADSTVSRRQVLKLGGAALAAGALAGPAVTAGADAQARRHVPAALARRPRAFRSPPDDRVLDHDPAVVRVQPPREGQGRLRGGAGHQPVEADLAESWERQGDTVYVFKLKKGVRWHPKPPVNGRELTAEDVRYTYDRFLNIKGNANRPVLEMVDKVEAVDKHTVQVHA